VLALKRRYGLGVAVTRPPARKTRPAKPAPPRREFKTER
jgi:hypothetical protein